MISGQLLHPISSAGRIELHSAGLRGYGTSEWSCICTTFSPLTIKYIHALMTLWQVAGVPLSSGYRRGGYLLILFIDNQKKKIK